MTWLVAGIVGIAAILVVLLLRAAGAAYRALFAPAHMVEFARLLGRLRAAALQRIETEPSPIAADDPRAGATAAGLVLVYTIHRQDNQFVHHYSLSMAGRRTHHGVGGTFVMYVARLLGVEPARLVLLVSQKGVHHAEFSLTPDQQEASAATAVRIPTEREIADMLPECTRWRDRAEFHRLDTSRPEP